VCPHIKQVENGSVLTITYDTGSFNRCSSRKLEESPKGLTFTCVQGDRLDGQRRGNRSRKSKRKEKRNKRKKVLL